jgi:nucleoid DNA-binding protein
MFNLVDLISMKHPEFKRDDIADILTAATNIVMESLDEGKGVQWIGLGTFTWKKKAATKKQAALWKEYPYLAEGEKGRFVPEEDGVKLLGEVSRKKRELPGEVLDAIQQSEGTT